MCTIMVYVWWSAKCVCLLQRWVTLGNKPKMCKISGGVCSPGCSSGVSGKWVFSSEMSHYMDILLYINVSICKSKSSHHCDRALRGNKCVLSHLGNIATKTWTVEANLRISLDISSTHWGPDMAPCHVIMKRTLNPIRSMCSFSERIIKDLTPMSEH